MAQVTFIIPNEILTRVLDGVAYANDYQDEIDGQPNPESKADYARRMVRVYVKQCVIAYESGQASQLAGDAAALAAEMEITISE